MSITATHGKSTFLVMGLLAGLLAISSGCVSSVQSSDARKQVGYYGIDYHRCIEECRSLDQALRRFFLFSTIVDASGHEEYAVDLRRVLDTVGEDRFIRVLQSVGYDVQMQVFSTIQYYEGLGQEDGGVSWSRFVVDYPRLGEMVLKSGE